MRFHDSLGLLQFSLPLGWGYDAWDSRLDLIGFRWWADRQQLLGVNLFGNPVAPEATDESWFGHVRKLDNANSLNLSVCQQLQGRCVATGEHFDDASGVYHRHAVVRGPGMNVFFDHAEMLSEKSQVDHGIQVLSPALRTALNSLAFPNEREPVVKPPDEHLAITARRAAVSANNQSDWKTVEENAALVLGEARRQAASELQANRLPNPGAVLMIVEALIMMGRAGNNPSQCFALADQLGRRARGSVVKTGWPRLEVMASFQQDLERLTRMAADHELAVMNAETPTLPPESLDGPDQGCLERRNARARWLQAQSAKWGESGEVESQESALNEALSEMATVVTAPYPLLDHEIRSIAHQFGFVETSQLSELAGMLTRRRTLEAMTHVLRQLEDLGFRGANAARNHEITEFALALARELANPPVLQTEPGLWLSIGSEAGRFDALVQAIVRRAYALISIGDLASMMSAQELVDEGGKLLGPGDNEGANTAIATEASIDPASVLKPMRAASPGTRVDFYCVAAKLALSRANREEARILVERGFEWWKKADPEERSMHSREDLEQLAGLLSHQMPPPSLAVFPSVESKSSYERLHRAFSLGNDAVSCLNNGQLDNCLRKVQEGLVEALAVSPFNEYVPNLLHLAALALKRRTDKIGLATWCFALAGALDCLDARRLMSLQEDVQVGLGEAKLTNEIQEEFLARLIDCNMAEEALAAADRTRGRTFALALSRASQPQASGQSPVKPAPDITRDDPLTGVNQAVAYVQEQFQHLVEATQIGTLISAAQARKLSKETNAVFLLIQPVKNRVGLIVVCPSGELSACWSPVSLETQRSALMELQAKHRVFQAARGEMCEGMTTQPSTTAANLEGNPAHVLWQALIAPVRDYLRPGAPLVLFPFRDFALLPFSVLQDATGSLLAGLHPLSLAPSLASLRSLRARGAWLRPVPQRAYLLGNPTISEAEKMRFKPLAGAEAEVHFLREELLSRGVAEGHVKLRIGPQGSESSYRTEAANCDLVHLACHGLMEEPAVRSYLALAPSPPHDGRLMVAEVPEVPLGDALVFLSACQTGQGRPTADGVIGLGRAFLEAGARAVVMSLWKVSDAASARLAKHFYRALLAPSPSRTASESLQEAMRLTREDLQAGRIMNAVGEPLSDREAYWAPFVIMGDAEAIRFGPQKNWHHAHNNPSV